MEDSHNRSVGIAFCVLLVFAVVLAISNIQLRETNDALRDVVLRQADYADRERAMYTRALLAAGVTEDQIRAMRMPAGRAE